MIIKRTNLGIFVAECEGCAFSGMSQFETDAAAIVERHQARCEKFLELTRKKESSPSSKTELPAAHADRK